jgi:hypothetical protein
MYIKVLEFIGSYLSHGSAITVSPENRGIVQFVEIPQPRILA